MALKNATDTDTRLELSGMTHLHQRVNESCANCPPLSETEAQAFNELAKIIRTSGKRINCNKDASDMVNFLKGKLSPDLNENENIYKRVVKLHNPSNRYKCDTLLHRASDNSDFEVISVLLEAGADPNATNFWRQLPLHTVVDEGDGIK